MVQTDDRNPKTKLLVWKHRASNRYGGVVCTLGDAPSARQEAYHKAAEAKAQAKKGRSRYVTLHRAERAG